MTNEVFNVDADPANALWFRLIAHPKRGKATTKSTVHVKATVHVGDYVRDGHPVRGYQYDRDHLASLGQSLMQVRPEMIDAAVAKRAERGMGDRHTRTTVPVEGRHGTRDALLIQATEFFKREDTFWQETLKSRLAKAATKKEKDEAKIDLYNERTAHKLWRLCADGYLSVRVPSQSLEGILASGRLRNGHDPAHNANDRTSRESYMSSRAEAERKVWNINDNNPDHHPIYGYVSLSNESNESIARAFGDAKITLKPDVHARTTVTYSDSLFVNVDNADAVPSPMNQPSHLSVVHWMNLGGVDAPVAFKGMQPRPEPPLPAKLQKLRDGFNPDAFNEQKNEWLDKIGYRKWPIGDFIEAQIHGGVSLHDIESIELPQQPSDELRKQLDESGIPWKVSKL